MIESIIKGFDVWTDAQGVKSKGRVKSLDNISLDGIISLRQLIIELGVRGKLVGQDEVDAPATDLLKEIIKNKEKLVHEGKVRKERNESDDLVTNKPFEAPNGWVWVTLQTISTINGGYAFKSGNYSDEGHRVVRISDFDEKGFKDSNVVRHKYSDALDPFLLFEKNILLAMTGGTVGKSYLVKELSEPMLVNQRVACINLIRPVHEEYIHYVIQSKHVKDVIEEAKNSTNDNISMADIKGFKIPLPPLAEQIRITEKMNELLSWCDEIEEQQTANITTHHYLVKSLLGTLTQANDADEVQTAWEKLSEHFDALFCSEDSIEQLKETIIQLALRGKLTKQDSEDENATDLKHKIFHDFERLAKEGTAKKPVVVTEINEEEMPYSLPINWAWVRLQEIIQISSGDGLTASNMNSNGEIPVYGGNGVNGYHDKYNIKKPTLVIGRVGFYCGSIHITPANAWVTDNAFITTFSEDNISIDFLYWLLKGTNLKENDNATAQPVISGRKIYPIVVGLPPLNEQKRIVEIINSLFSICDALNFRIEKSQQIKELLSQTVIATAT